MDIFGREPVRWVGIIVSVIFAVSSTLLGEGVISDATAGRVTDIVGALSGALIFILPWITAEIARRGVTPVYAPSLPAGTIVKVEGTSVTSIVG